jgi:ferrochelatase
LKDSINSYNGDIQLSFQSRFGPEEWLQPYTEETVINLAKNGCKKLAVLSPAFISDCVETLEEIDIGIKEVFLDNGGKDFTLIPCLNDSEEGIGLLDKLVMNELKGWI